MEQEMNFNPEGQRNKHFTSPQMLPNMPHDGTVHHDLPKSIIEYQTSLGRTNYGFTLSLSGEKADSRSIQVNHGSVPPSTRSVDDPTANDTNYFAAPAVWDEVNNSSTCTNRQSGHPSVGLGSQRYDFTARHNREQGHKFFGDVTAEDSLKVDGHGTQLSCLARMVNNNGLALAEILGERSRISYLDNDQDTVLFAIQDDFSAGSIETRLKRWAYEFSDTSITFTERLEKRKWGHWSLAVC